MGKKRQTAKTGDKAIYKSREAVLDATPSYDSDGDVVFDEVDRFHNTREAEDLIRFENDEADSDYDDGVTKEREGVFDLGGGVSSEDDDQISSDEEEREIPTEGLNYENDEVDATSKVESDEDSDSDSEGDEEDQTKTNIMDWGRKKRDYYHGDTADLEIGQAEGDAKLEEVAAREIVRARLKVMEEGDFMPEGEIDDDNESGELKNSGEKKVKETETHLELKDNSSTMFMESMHSGPSKSLLKLSNKSKIKLFNSAHPEMYPLVTHFRDGPIRQLLNETLIVSKELLEDSENAEAVGTTTDGTKYLITKEMLQVSSALNVCQYLLLKAEQVALSHATTANGSSNEDDDTTDAVKSHPVIRRLNQLVDLTERLANDVESKVPGLKEQVCSLVKAAKMVDKEKEPNFNDSNNNDDTALLDSNADLDHGVECGSDGELKDSSHLTALVNTERTPDTSSDNDFEENENMTLAKAATEARYAFRPQDVTSKKSDPRRRKLLISSALTDFGDVDDKGETANAASRSLATTLNTISQRSKNRNKKTDAAPEGEDDDYDEDRFARGLEMMEEELGQDVDEGCVNKVDDDELNDDVDDNNFYKQIEKKNKAKKALKKSLYVVAPKYPSIAGEIEGERAVTNTIMKNRGLVAHKSKLNRNPRVKKREQYRKALIRRKGAVREIRTEEGHKYGGETTGIKSNLSRSRKLTT